MTQTTAEGTGFEGTIGYIEWSQDIPQLAGITHGCTSGWNTTPVAGADQTVQISAGTGFGWGITIETPTSTVQLPVPTTPTWYLVGWVLTWTNTGGTIMLDKTPVDISAAAPAPQPGTTAMIPVARVQVSPGQQLPTQIVDVRQYGSQIISAPSLSAICWPGEGDVACVGGSFYRYANGSWVSVRPGTVTWDATIPAPAQGGSVVSGAEIPSQSWVFPTWAPSAANTLTLATAASASPQNNVVYTFPSPGLYSVSWNFTASPVGVGAFGIFKNPSIPSAITAKPTNMFRKVSAQGGSTLLEVRDTSVNYVFGYQNNGASTQSFSLSGAWLQIVRMGDLS